MRAGPLNKVISVEKYSVIKDTYGQDIITYILLKTTRASVSPLSGKETYVNDSLLTEISHKVEIRYDVNLLLNQKDRIIFKTRIFNIKEVINFGENNKSLILLCSEEV